jgi:hypothetical protein
MELPFETPLATLNGAYNRTRYPGTPPHGIGDPEPVLDDVESLLDHVKREANP